MSARRKNEENLKKLRQKLNNQLLIDNNTPSISAIILNEERFSKRHAGDDYGHQKPNDKSKKYPPQSGL